MLAPTSISSFIRRRRGSTSTCASLSSKIRDLGVCSSGSELVITGSDYHDSANVLLITYLPSPEDVVIKGGENGGRTLPHRNIVKDVSEIGVWHPDGETRIPLPKKAHGLERAVIIQAGKGGAIIGAAKI